MTTILRLILGIKVTDGQKDCYKFSLRNVNVSVKEIFMKDRLLGIIDWFISSRFNHPYLKLRNFLKIIIAIAIVCFVNCHS